ncbi:MAG: RNA polymerase sigma factor, partial [Actinomycetota bacterium]
RVLLEAARAGLFERETELPEREDPHRDRSDERIDLERALASLGVADREALVMVDVLGFEPIEVAGMMGVTPETFRVRLHRARGRLREAYGHE